MNKCEECGGYFGVHRSWCATLLPMVSEMKPKAIRLILREQNGRLKAQYVVRTKRGIEVRKWRESRNNKKAWRKRNGQTSVYFDEFMYSEDLLAPRRQLLHKGKKA